MRTDLNTLKKIAHLSRLNLDKENEQKLLEDFNKMIAFVEKLKETDTAGVEPLVSMTEEINSFREDQVKDEIPASEALRNNPASDSIWFKVPKVIK
jgi:aspartyl-tRNA(Asn)/glutamyl-tRNA(Gln) amidotransferase subunit C